MDRFKIDRGRRSHTLAGVWIEARSLPSSRGSASGHTLAGVWIEAGGPRALCQILAGHTLAGVWIEAMCAVCR